MTERSPIAADWSVKEQIIEDVDLTIQFEVLPNGERVMRLFGAACQYGNREITFCRDGHETGAGAFTTLCKPTWPTDTEGNKDIVQPPEVASKQEVVDLYDLLRDTLYRLQADGMIRVDLSDLIARVKAMRPLTREQAERDVDDDVQEK